MASSRHHNTYIDGAAIFWTNSIVEGIPILRSPTAARSLVEIIEDCRCGYGVKIPGYVVMPDHFHIIAWAEDVNHTKLFIRQILSRSSATFAVMTDTAADRGDAHARLWSQIFHAKATGKSTVRIWKERGRAFPITTEAVLLEKLQYIHNNPVRAGLVEHVEDWEFSSAACLASGHSPAKHQRLLLDTGEST
ncbi:MAG: transposase [Armatimonadota bacterium]